MCRRVEERFPTRPESVPKARALVAAALARWGVVDADPARAALDDVLLVVTELIANAIKSSSSVVGLTLTAHRDHLEVAVTDSDPRPARFVRPTPDDIGGRGVAIVKALSFSWGQEPYDGRTKRVWSRVAVPAGSALGHGCTI